MDRGVKSGNFFMSFCLSASFMQAAVWSKHSQHPQSVLVLLTSEIASRNQLQLAEQHKLEVQLD
jgi:hypothetical protein